MNRQRRNKLTLILLALFVLGLACALVLFALRQNINLFYTPSELKSASTLPKQDIKIGGMVAPGTVKYAADDLKVSFTITDFEEQVDVYYNGVLPDLFREGKGIVVQGRYIDGHVNATQVLAKHDENYMPPQMSKIGKKT